MIHILHLSDIHLGTVDDARQYGMQLITDLTRELNISKLDYLVISGDIGTYSTEEEYKAATVLIDEITERFPIEKENLIIVPGNHDLSWELSGAAYEMKYEYQLQKPLPEDFEKDAVKAGDLGYLVPDKKKLQKRFSNFSEHFFRPVTGNPYPETDDGQGMAFVDQKNKIIFLALNSSCRIDHLHKDRSGIHRNALTAALKSIEKYTEDDWLKIAVFHHPVTGAQCMKQTEFLQQLSVHGFKAALHGHIHEAEKGDYNYDEARGIKLIGAGTFGAPAPEMVDRVPHQYNLLVHDRERGMITVHTRKKEKPLGAWDPDYRWGKKSDKKPWYTINLRKNGPEAPDKPENKENPINIFGAVPYSTPPPDPERHRKNYLLELSSATRNLPWSSLDPEYADATCSLKGEGRIGLLDIYTALDTLEMERPPEDEPGARLHMANRDKERRISAQEMVNRQRRLVLLGDPGSGKSTLVNYLAHVLANAHLEKEPDGWMARLKKTGPWDLGPLFPVRVLLREFAAFAGRCKAKKGDADLLRQYLKEDFAKSEFFGFWDNFYDRLLSSEPGQGCLILLDGLDEVSTELRRVVLDSIEDFSTHFKNHRYLATCRIYAYIGPEHQLSGFKPATLMPFDRERIEKFIDIWYDRHFQMGRFSETEAVHWAKRLKEATKREELSGLAERPLLLTVMAMLHSFKGELPDDRVELYQGTVELLLRRWEKRLGGDEGLLEALNITGLKMKFLEATLCRAAFDMHANQDPDTDTADISRGRLMEIVAKRFGDWNKAEVFVNYVKDRAGLLVCHRTDTFAFPHRTFQEFMAACYLVDHPDYPSEAARLVSEDPQKWRMVFVLAARKAHAGPGISAIMNLCPRSFAETREPNAAAFHRAGIAAEALLEIGVMDARQSEPGQAMLEKTIQWMKEAILADQVLSPKERASGGNLLAGLGDPRFDPDRWYLPDEKMLGFVEIKAGTFQMGTLKEDIPALEKEFGKYDEKYYKYEYETPLHPVELDRFYMARYPVTVAQFRAFCQDSGHEVDDPEYEQYNTVDNHPVVCVSWHDADAYCRWLTEKLGWPGWTVTLPTEAQWEKAARGKDGKIFPWGNNKDGNRMNFYDTKIGSTSSVGCFPGGASPHECEEMAGNVVEWTRSLWGGDWDKPDFVYPYKPGDDREDMSGGLVRVVRGGSWGDFARGCRSAYRFRIRPVFRNRFLGFRLACLPGQE